MKTWNSALLAGAALMLAACGGEKATGAPAAGAEAEPGAALEAVIAGEHRSPEEKARDQYRHPKETLDFFGIEPEMTVVEIWPGGGWYTQILAPYLKAGGGKLYAAGLSPVGANERVRKSIEDFDKTYVSRPELYGEIEVTVLGDGGGDIAPPGSADAVVTFRNVHNWLPRGVGEENFAKFYRALKPGGVLGVVDHRADGTDLPHDGSTGYVYTDDVIALAEAAGFDFEGASEVNANPADTKDHPFGVWTLPPSRRTSATRGLEDPNFDRAPYDAIGESDRMTLRFRKPLAADGALLE